jgi:hypothetical protein
VVGRDDERIADVARREMVGTCLDAVIDRTLIHYAARCGHCRASCKGGDDVIHGVCAVHEACGGRVHCAQDGARHERKNVPRGSNASGANDWTGPLAACCSNVGAAEADLDDEKGFDDGQEEGVDASDVWAIAKSAAVDAVGGEVIAADADSLNRY